MPKLEWFFDYACPYCLRGHESLLELLPDYPGLEIQWRPCEAHPRPERHGAHSDLCARGMLFAMEHGADIMQYHKRMYRAAITDRADIENPRVIASLCEGLLDTEALYKALSEGAYEDKLLENNRLAWETHRFPAVPSCRMNGESLKSASGVGITKAQLARLLDSHCGK